LIAEHVQAALTQVSYEIIEGGEHLYGELPAVCGDWATGKSVDKC